VIPVQFDHPRDSLGCQVLPKVTVEGRVDGERRLRDRLPRRIRQNPATKYKRSFESDALLIEKLQQRESTLLVKVFDDLIRTLLAFEGTKLVELVDGRLVRVVVLIVIVYRVVGGCSE
jgi:hypothetical protein